MENYVIIFNYHRSDRDVTQHHYDLIKQHNPNVPVFPISSSQDYLPNTFKWQPNLPILPTEDSSDYYDWREVSRSSTWHEYDKAFIAWFRNRPVDAKRYVFCEWDVLCQISFQEYFRDYWDCQVVGNKTFSQGDWCWWRDIERLPPDYQPYATAMVPLSLVMFSHDALRTISENFPEMYCYCELRLATTAVKCGIPISAMMSPTIDWDRIKVGPYKSCWHKVDYSTTRE